jgi:hypothetical protein
VTDPPSSGGAPDDPLLRAVARYWEEIRRLADGEQWERLREIIAGTYAPGPREAYAELGDVLLDILPPDHEICDIMRSGVMSGTAKDAQAFDAEMLEQLWLLSELVQPGESAWRDLDGTDDADEADDDIDLLVRARLLGLLMLTSEDARRRGVNPDDVGLIRLRRPGAVTSARLPAFQFGPAGDPWDVVMEVNQVLGASDDPWGVTCWWVDPHARLGDAPADLLGRGLDGLIRRAAQDVVEGY